MVSSDSKYDQASVAAHVRSVVTVDGGGASGKSALARLLAERLGYAHLNSGLLYRAAAFLADNAGISLTDGESVRAHLAKHSIELTYDPALGAVVTIDGSEHEAELMSRRISEAASQVAKHKQVREFFLNVQRHAFEPMGVVAEGRDMGTIVFPDAPVKFFVDARLDVRARRRLEQLQARGQQGDFEGIKRELAERDERDASRSTAPMKPADGAIIIDNSDTPLSDTVERMLQLVQEQSGKNRPRVA